MSRPQIEAVTAASLPEFAEFLHQHLDSSRSSQEWAAQLRRSWMDQPPNHGFVLRVDGAIVGGIGAFYAEREIAGQTQRTCNISSWCVLDAYRSQSMRLAMALTSQPGFSFSDFSPTKVVAGTLSFLKFKNLADGEWVLPNLPLPAAGRLLTKPADIETTLSGSALQDYLRHRDFPWLHHVVVGHTGAWCHVIYKRRALKGMTSAAVLHASDRALLARHWRRLGWHFLRRGLLLAQLPCWLSPAAPAAPARLRSGFNPKQYLSSTILPEQIDMLYSEQMALDL
ncbi:MAG: hypothetical protein ACK4F7_00860 [Inhella sp.]